MQIAQNKWLRAAFWGTVLLIFLFCLLFPAWSRRALKQDRAGAVPQQGVATVAMLIDAKPSVTDKPSPAQVLVRFHGQLCSAKTIGGFDQLREGQPARILYRVGRSGRIYVDRVEPLPAASAASRNTNDAH
ncbi:MAG TPA: hypothetical protein VFB38_15545 [Chthonomonadaceae bacterium]|nr:hypothetical protein [Chthonomonadaceae bacterium]